MARRIKIGYGPEVPVFHVDGRPSLALLRDGCQRERLAGQKRLI
jgi:hypothetical protein